MTADLPTSTLGRTGLKVTRLGYGAIEIRGGGRGRPVSDADASAILNAVLDAGINYIDTSQDYGRSEELIGTSIAHRRTEYVLATKCGCVPAGGEHVWTPDNCWRGLDLSLERMQTDYVDVMQLHNPSVGDTEAGGLVESLNAMRATGKVRWIGVSTTSPYLSTYLANGHFDVFQIPYSGLERTHENWITASAAAAIGTVIRGGVAKGEPADGRGHPERWDTFAAADLDELRAPGESRTAFMLRFTLAHPHINTTIVGTQSLEHLEENVKAAQTGPLDESTYTEAKQRIERTGVTAETAL